MMKSFLYIFISFTMPVIFLLDYASVYREYFTTVVELTNSPVFRLLCANLFLAVTLLIWIISRSIFFGKLNNAESEMVRNSLFGYITEYFIWFSSLGLTLLSSVGAISLFTVVVGLLHELAQERATTLHIIENRPTRLRMLSGLALFFALAMPIDLYVVFDVMVNSAWQNEEYLSQHYCIAVLYLYFALCNVKLVMRLLFSEVIGETNHRSLAFYVEFIFSLIQSIIFFISFAYACAMSQAVFLLIRLLFRQVKTIVEKIQSFTRYRTLTRFINTMNNATEEDIASDPRCAVCYDDMLPEQGCKKLPCGHCYHENCLRRCFETMSTCPYCRIDLMKQVRLAKETRNRQENTTVNVQRVEIVNNEPQAPDNIIQERWHVFNEDEVRRAYARYRENLQQQQLQQQQQQNVVQSSEVLGRENILNAGQENISYNTSVNSVRVNNSNNNNNNTATPTTATYSSSVSASTVNQEEEKSFEKMFHGFDMAKMQFKTREQQKLLAYQEYEKAVKAASEALQQRLREIDYSS